MARLGCVFVFVVVATLAGPASSAPAVDSADRRSGGGLGFGLGLGVLSAPGLACRVEAHAGCSGSTFALAARGQVAYALGARWSAGLVMGFAADLDFLQSTTGQGGYVEDGRRFVDLLARARRLLGEPQWGWVGLEAGLALAQDWIARYDRDDDGDDRRVSRSSARQYGPSLGALAGFRIAGNQRLAVDVEIGGRVTAWGHDPPPLIGAASNGSSALATRYGRRLFLWAGIGARFGR